MSWLVAHGDGVLLALHIQPGAKKTEIVGPYGEALKIRLAAPPVDGKANVALIKFLAETLGVPRDSVAIATGHGSRRKGVEIRGVNPGEVAALLTIRAS